MQDVEIKCPDDGEGDTVCVTWQTRDGDMK